MSLNAEQLTHFIDMCLIEIPVSDTELRQCMSSIKESVAYAPPELIAGWKGRVGEVLYHTFNVEGVQRQQWHHRVALMWDNLK